MSRPRFLGGSFVFDITVLGELLIDFTEQGETESGITLFARNPGGAVANVAVAAAKQGARCSFIGKVGADLHGKFLRETLERNGVDTRALRVTRDAFTTLAFVALDHGERSFAFARNPGADTLLAPDELDDTLLQNTRVLHIGSLSLTDEPSRTATLRAIAVAKSAGAIISYDPNYRAPLWKNEADARLQMRSLLPYVDVMKLSEEECELLTDSKSPDVAARHLWRLGAQCVVVTLGARGALFCFRGKTAEVPGFLVEVVDTTGAGDAFWGGFLAGLLQTPPQTLAEMAALVRRGNAVAALCVGKSGGIPAMPEQFEVDALLQDGQSSLFF